MISRDTQAATEPDRFDELLGEVKCREPIRRISDEVLRRIELDVDVFELCGDRI